MRAMAVGHGIDTVDSALIVGFEPQECERLTKQALDGGQAEFWKTRTKRVM